MTENNDITVEQAIILGDYLEDNGWDVWRHDKACTVKDCRFKGYSGGSDYDYCPYDGTELVELGDKDTIEILQEAVKKALS